MKKLIITCVLLTSVSFIASAQTNEVKSTTTTTTSQGPVVVAHKLNATELKASNLKAEKSAKALVSKLGLTKEQYTGVYNAECKYQAYYDRFPAGKIPGGTLSNITSERKKDLKEVLTPEQFEKFIAMSSQAKQK